VRPPLASLTLAAFIVASCEDELRGLIEKANETGAGAVVGSVAYRSDYEAVLTEEKMVRRTAREKNCSFMADYQSDHIIR
jgi:hypothetical protein